MFIVYDIGKYFKWKDNKRHTLLVFKINST